MNTKSRRPRHSRAIDLGRRIRNARESQGFSLRETAKSVDVSPSYLSRCERGELDSPPSEDVIRRIAASLDASIVAELLHLAGRVPADIEQIILHDPNMPDALRNAKKFGIDGKSLLLLIAKVVP